MVRALPQLQPRDLTWDGCLNVRDLGGLPTRDGHETRRGAVVRADSVRRLSDEGWQALVDHGVRTVIDLRGSHEREDDPPAEMPVEVVHVPFMENSEVEWDEIADELDAANAAAPDVPTAPGGDVVIHCAGGKDWTGLLAAFLLHLAGVDDEEIAADYALGENRLRPRHEPWLRAAETEEELDRLRRMAQTPAASMTGVFAELERRHGSVESYLRGAGVTGDELERVRTRLRG